jgi:hypothetical protein
VLRWELTEWSVDDAKLSAHIELDPWADYAMRCERDGGAAAGPGIGCVLRGELMVDGEPVQPFGAFVEPAELAGRGSFVRVVLVRAEDSNGAEALAQGAYIFEGDGRDADQREEGPGMKFVLAAFLALALAGCGSRRATTPLRPCR